MTDIGARDAIERTRLAWRRTTLTAAAVLLLGVSAFRRACEQNIEHCAVGAGRTVALVAVGLMAMLWLGVLVVAHRRIAALERGVTASVTRSPALLAVLVAGCAALSVLLVK